MAAVKLLIALACIHAALALPPTTPTPRRQNIFFEEKLPGEAFEHVDAFEDMTYDEITPYNDIISDGPYRLPNTTRPEKYSVLWAVEFTNFALSGQVAIELYATQANVNQIVIHSKDLTIGAYSLRLLNSNNTIAVNMVANAQYEFLTFTLQTGNLQYNVNNRVMYVLTISFEAPLRTDMYGIYRNWYKHNGVSRYMASTQFQATYARTAFPCYDEPGFKAYFDITIRRPTSYSSWSNMRLLRTDNSTVPGFQEDVFYRTPYMSTYLIAIIVAEYDAIRAVNNQQAVTYEVIARPNAIQAGQGNYSFNVGQELLAKMSEHTMLDFFTHDPNIKMTQAAIPDFGAGAMENWGLLTYREAYLMFDPIHTSDYYKQVIGYILSHEITHMWFGNLVTCNWWDVLWLNEGFARYYQYFLTSWVETEMGFETRFIVEQLHTSALTDSGNNPQPLNNPGVGSPAQVSSMFSTISYNKGACIIRMTEHLLGFEVNRQGLANYLSRNAYGVAQPSTLFDALEGAALSSGAIAEYGSDFSLFEYYFSWTNQRGIPVLNVQVNHQTGQMTIQQRRFNINSGYSPVNTLWIVPINFATASNPNFNNTKPTHILRNEVTVINRTTVGDEWVILNRQATGYYRVNYDDYTWDLIIMALRGNQRTLIHEYNRAQIVNDVFQFARAGLMTYTRALNILSFLEEETDYAPWVAAITGFSWIRNRLAVSPDLQRVDALIQRWATKVMTELGYNAVPNESFMRSYLRFQLAPLMCLTGNVTCRAAARAQFAALRNNNVEVDRNNRLWVYCNGLRDGTVADFNALWQRFQNHNVYTEKILLLQVLGCTHHEASLRTLLNAIVQENEIIRPQDYTTAYNSAVTGNEGNTQIVLQYLQENLQTVAQAFGNLATPFSYVTARFRTQAEITAFRNWAQANQAALGTSATAVYNGAEESVYNLQWSAAVASDLNSYLVAGDNVVQTSTSPPSTISNPTTVTAPTFTEPISPEIPDAASTSFVSMFAIVFAVAAYIVA